MPLILPPAPLLSLPTIDDEHDTSDASDATPIASQAAQTAVQEALKNLRMIASPDVVDDQYESDHILSPLNSSADSSQVHNSQVTPNSL